jgi:actin-related protein
MVSEQFNPIIFDLGSSTARAGWAGHDQPKFIEASYMQRRPDKSIDPIPVRFLKKPYQEYPNIERVQQFDPESGCWLMQPDAMTALADSLLYSSRGLECTSMDRPLFATCPTEASREFKKVYYEHFMETAQVPAFFLGDTSTLAMFAVGRTSGLCVDIGASSTTVARIDKGECVTSTTYAYGGDNIDSYILSKVDGIEAPSLEIKLALAREIKHSACKCSHQPLPPAPSTTPAGSRSTRGGSRKPLQSPKHNADHIVIKLPDGSEVDVAGVNEYAAETLFCEQEEFLGLTAAVRQSGESEFVLLTGGSAHFQGLHTRLVNELQQESLHVFPFAQWTHRMHSSFVGASILASLSSFASLWVTPECYFESGVDRFIGLK